MTGENNEYLGKLARLNLCTLPTPLMEANRLSEVLGGPRILIKRDDLTGLAVGGNKSRGLEFIMAKIKSSGADTIVAIGPQQSNQLCCITAAAKKCGLDVFLLLLKGDNLVQGNLLLFQLLGAETRLMDIDILNMPEAEKQMQNLVEQLQKKGKKPFQFPYGPMPLLGIAGYINLTREICQQLAERKIDAHHIFVGSGSGCTQAGFILGNKLLKANFKINGVMLDLRFSQEQHQQIVFKEATEAAKLLNLKVDPDYHEVSCIDGYIEHYGTTERGLQAIKLVAETEGIFLDPTYTGKVMAAMIDEIRDGRLTREDTVVFYHSGGIPAIFSHSHELVAE